MYGLLFIVDTLSTVIIRCNFELLSLLKIVIFHAKDRYKRKDFITMKWFSFQMFRIISVMKTVYCDIEDCLY